MSTESKRDEDLMTVTEAADYLRVPVSWVYGRTRRQKLPMIRVGKHIRFSRQALIKWVAAQEV
jgi:excisionase family DNA binding protein